MSSGCLNNVRIEDRSVVDGAIVFPSEPFHGLVLGDFVLVADSSFASPSETDSASGSFQDDIEVHAEDTGEGIILHSQINMLLNTESEAAYNMITIIYLSRRSSSF